MKWIIMSVFVGALGCGGEDINPGKICKDFIETMAVYANRCEGVPQYITKNALEKQFRDCRFLPEEALLKMERCTYFLRNALCSTFISPDCR